MKKEQYIVIFEKSKYDNIQEAQLKILKNHLKFKTSNRYHAFDGFCINSRWQNYKERPNRSTINRDMVDKAKCDTSEWHDPS